MAKVSGYRIVLPVATDLTTSLVRNLPAGYPLLLTTALMTLTELLSVSRRLRSDGVGLRIVLALEVPMGRGSTAGRFLTHTNLEGLPSRCLDSCLEIDAPSMNAPSNTEPLPVIIGVPEPLLFASIEEVVKGKALRQIKTWKASFRRMEPAAKKGKWRLAKVRRSADLWLSEEEATMPKTKGLYVDLRPLARGDPAIG